MPLEHETGKPWLEDADLAQRLKDVLQRAKIEEPAPWDTIVHDANISAYQCIVAALGDRGYSQDQIDAWDYGETFNIDLGLFWALIKGGCTKAYDETFIKELDRREELLTVGVVIDGEIITPGASTSSAVKSGHMESNDDVFRRPKPWRRTCGPFWQ